MLLAAAADEARLPASSFPAAWSTRPPAKYRKWCTIIFAIGSGLALGFLLSTSAISFHDVM